MTIRVTKVFFPILGSGIEEGSVLTGHRVDGSNIGALVPVAPHARKSRIVQIRLATML